MRTLSAELQDITLPNDSGSQIRLGSLWESNPAVIAFLRHYG